MLSILIMAYTGGIILKKNIDDLFKLVENHTEYYAGGDGTHFVPVGVSALATQVSNVIKEIIEKK